MITILSKIFVNGGMSEDRKRAVYGMLCGILGIVLNVLLFAGKLFAGIISNSVSIMADAFNNLSDAGSSVITLVGFKLSTQKPDSDHPYGHGRMEYISGLVISAIILLMGFKLFEESIGKILNPEPVEFSAVTLVILIGSILIKCYMAYYNSSIGKKIDSSPLKATAVDSLSDCIATTVVLVSAVIAHIAGINLDGWSGILVSLFIFYAGFSAGKEAIDPLLGTPPEREYIERIESIVLGFHEDIVGVHDLMIHDYGPGRKIISLHAEVPCDRNILELHDIIDVLEKTLDKELGCVTTIHMDPVDLNNPEVARLKSEVANLVKEIHEDITIHDFRVVFGETHINLIFDMAVPFVCKLDDSQVCIEARQLIKAHIGDNYYAVIEVDRDNYVSMG